MRTYTALESLYSAPVRRAANIRAVIAAGFAAAATGLIWQLTSGAPSVLLAVVLGMLLVGAVVLWFPAGRRLRRAVAAVPTAASSHQVRMSEDTIDLGADVVDWAGVHSLNILTYSLRTFGAVDDALVCFGTSQGPVYARGLGFRLAPEQLRGFVADLRDMAAKKRIDVRGAHYDMTVERW